MAWFTSFLSFVLKETPNNIGFNGDTIRLCGYILYGIISVIIPTLNRETHKIFPEEITFLLLLVNNSPLLSNNQDQ